VSPAAGTSARSLWLWTTIALGVVLLAVVATIATLALVRDDGTRELQSAAMPWEDPGGETTETSRDVAAAARTETLAFLEVDYRAMEPLTEKVLDGATGEFKKQYADRVEDLVTQAKENKSISEGEVVALGIGELDDDSALVHVAANSQVQNSTTGGTPQPRYYRLQLDMVREGDQCLVSQLQFVG
jgi:Mce-associated membrane protein